MTEVANQVLTEQCRAGNREALGELLRRHRPLIWRLARRMVADEVEDVVQDALVAIVTGIHRFRGEARLSTWIAGVTIRTAMRHAERRRRREAAVASLEVSTHHSHSHTSSAGDPAHAVEGREFLDHLQAAIQALPPQQRAVIALRHMEGMQIEEVARALGAPTGTVKSRLHHARRALRQLMAPYLEG